MNSYGPSLQLLLQRIAECPADFLEEPCIGSKGRLAVAALVNDCLRRHGYCISVVDLQALQSKSANRKQLQLAALCAWLLGENWFHSANIEANALFELFNHGLTELAKFSDVDKCVHDAERREEFARFILARLDYRPAGETLAQASDRLSALSSVERQRLLRESQVAEKRAREIREALARKAAEESADKWTRE